MDEKKTWQTGTPADEFTPEGGASGGQDNRGSSYQPGQGGKGGTGYQPGQSEAAGGTTSQLGKGSQGGSQATDSNKETDRGTPGGES